MNIANKKLEIKNEAVQNQKLFIVFFFRSRFDEYQFFQRYQS